MPVGARGVTGQLRGRPIQRGHAPQEGRRGGNGGPSIAEGARWSPHVAAVARRQPATRNYLVPRNETQAPTRRPTSKRPRRPQGEADAAPTAPPRRTARHAVRRHTGAERRRDRRRRRAARRRTSQHMKSRFTYAVLSTTPWHDAHLIQLFHLPCARKQASHAPGWGFGGSDLFGVLARVPAPPRPRREAREGDKTTDKDDEQEQVRAVQHAGSTWRAGARAGGEVACREKIDVGGRNRRRRRRLRRGGRRWDGAAGGWRVRGLKQARTARRARADALGARAAAREAAPCTTPRACACPRARAFSSRRGALSAKVTRCAAPDAAVRRQQQGQGRQNCPRARRPVRCAAKAGRKALAAAHEAARCAGQRRSGDVRGASCRAAGACGRSGSRRWRRGAGRAALAGGGASAMAEPTRQSALARQAARRPRPSSVRGGGHRREQWRQWRRQRRRGRGR